MTTTFKKAVKYNAKLRMALAGPSGSGKTFTALTLAHGLADGGTVAVIDTERGSASKYADVFPEFDVVDLESFNPNNYIDAIKSAGEAGYAVLVIDSLSHAWNGPGGLLEMVENISRKSQSKSTFNAWSEATPLQNRLIDAITRCPMHIICTMRTKTEYVIEQNNQGKSAPRKVGTAPVQRADVEYEFDVYADMDIDNTLIIHKSRCSLLAGAVISKPGVEVAQALKSWLDGAPAPAYVPPAPAKLVSRDQLNALFVAGKEKKLFSNLASMAKYAVKALDLPEDTTVVLTELTEDEGIRLDYAIAGAGAEAKVAQPVG